MLGGVEVAGGDVCERVVAGCSPAAFRLILYVSAARTIRAPMRKPIRLATITTIRFCPAVRSPVVAGAGDIGAPAAGMYDGLVGAEFI
jgi:hypothetical protein